VLVDTAKSRLFEDIDASVLPGALGGTAVVDWGACVDGMLGLEEE